MRDAFQSYPLGHSVTGSPHSVCVSLPTLADVIAYEEKDPATLQAFQSGYPRFFRNPLIRQLSAHWAAAERMHPNDPLLADETAAIDLCAFARIPARNVRQLDAAVWSVALPPGPTVLAEAQAFLRHTGAGISSREAEAILERDFGLPSYPEMRATGTAADHRRLIREHLHDVYGTDHLDDIHLFRSGMNAFYSGFRALQGIQLEHGKDLWIQLGWLYVDTSCILERFATRNAQPIRILQVCDMDTIRDTFREHGQRIAGIVTEVPTNPLVQTPDIDVLRGLADDYRAALILDPTLVSPHNVNILSYADLHINSLTKYAAAEADVMMGALALNPRSRFYKELLDSAPAFGTPPASADLARMAAQIPRYEHIVERVNLSTEQVAAFLADHPAVRSLHWARSEPSGYHYQWLQHRSCGPGAIVSFSLKGSMRAFYDSCRFVKSPSFGARFTLLCPFMYLAHYNLVTTPSGRQFLLDNGLEPELIRLSVGTEPVDDILAELDRSLAGSLDG